MPKLLIPAPDEPPPPEPRKSRAGLIVAVVALLAIGAGAGFYITRARKKPSASHAYGQLHACLFGPVLAEGESFDTRTRSIDAALGEERGDYPARCEPALTTFYESLGGDPKSDGLKEVLEIELGCKDKCSTASLIKKISQIHDIAASAKIKPEGADEVANVPPRLTGKPLKASEFREIVPGTVVLQGLTSLGPGKTALLYKDTVGILHLCEIEPDGERPLACAPIRVPVGAQTARLVEGKEKPTIYGVVSMGATPEETKYGVFDAKLGEPTGDDPKEVKSATDRPRLPASSPTWVEAPLEGTKLRVYRAKNGVLRLDREGDAPRFIMDDSDHDGPATGEPIPFVGQKRAVVLFTGKQGISGLIVKGDGSVEPAK